MGLDIELARLLLEAHAGGASFRDTLTLGRQHYFPSNLETARLLSEFPRAAAACSQFPELGRPRYSEPFLQFLGAKRTESLDISGFEGATIIHDLNLPIPPELRGTFDAVCDMGTIEHVFDFKRAIHNCMDLVRRDGRLYLYTVANNFFGHGFYQFSPELFFRILAPQFGYAVERVVAVEYGPSRKHFEVHDPDQLRHRVTVVNSWPVLLFVQARRTSAAPTPELSVQQSDYVAMWAAAGAGTQNSAAERSLSERIKERMLEHHPRLARFMEAFLFSAWNPGFSFRNRRSFRRLR